MIKRLLCNLIFSSLILTSTCHAITLNDKGQINATSVDRVSHILAESDIVKSIQQARKEHLPVAIMGKRSSEGGQTLYSNAIELDMLPYDKIINLDLDKKQVTVQSGITWSALQHYLNQYKLTFGVVTPFENDSVGGSISVNAHGDDFRLGTINRSIVKLSLISAKAQRMVIDPKRSPELWKAVIGGYGLLGVISEVTLQLVDDNLLLGQYKKISLEQFPTYFKKQILGNKDAALFVGYLDIESNQHLLRDMYVASFFNKSDPNAKVETKLPILEKSKFEEAREDGAGKNALWLTENEYFKTIFDDKVLLRHVILFESLGFDKNYHSQTDADWVQEYFIPVDHFIGFINKLRSVVKEHKINLLNVSIRYVPADPNAMLSYAKTNCFSINLYFNEKLSPGEVKKSEIWIRDLIDIALKNNGSYSLMAQDFATKEEFKRAYTKYRKFTEVKRKYDPQELFMSKFYKTYFQ